MRVSFLILLAILYLFHLDLFDLWLFYLFYSYTLKFIIAYLICLAFFYTTASMRVSFLILLAILYLFYLWLFYFWLFYLFYSYTLEFSITRLICFAFIYTPTSKRISLFSFWTSIVILTTMDAIVDRWMNAIVDAIVDRWMNAIVNAIVYRWMNRMDTIVNAIVYRWMNRMDTIANTIVNTIVDATMNRWRHNDRVITLNNESECLFLFTS